MKQKKIFLCFIILVSFGMPTWAKSTIVGVQAINPISTTKPQKEITIKLVEDLNLADEIKLNAGTEMSSDVISISHPKRMKRDAKFSFEPKTYKDAEGNIKHIDKKIEATYSKKINKCKMAEKIALGVGGCFVKGLSMGVAAVEGAIENNENNRIKSSAHSIYDASPLSYINKGKDISINQGEIFFLKFKIKQ